MAKRKLNLYLLPLSLGLALLFEFLLWGKTWGISFPIFTLIIIGLGFWFSRRAGVQPARNSQWLVVAIVFFSMSSALRAEPLTRWLDFALTLLLLMLLAQTWASGEWPQYQLKDYFTKALLFTPLSLREGNAALGESNRKSSAGRQKAFALLRGLLLALPVFVFFAALLASADRLFSELLERATEILFAWIRPETLIAIPRVLLIGLLIAGVYLFALNRSKDDRLVKASFFKPFLGFTESMFVLLSVELLFLAFIALQIGYLFGGAANVTIEGFTYAEYARRGFFELVVTSVFALGLTVAINTVTKLRSASQQRTLRVALVALFAMLGVVLVSAFARLALYVDAYGLSGTRVYGIVFATWLAVLLVALAIFEWRRQSNRLALALLLALIGFVASLNLVNVDALVARANVNRFIGNPTAGTQPDYSDQIDIIYLSKLSTDALPTMVHALDAAVANEGADSAKASYLAASLACFASNNDFMQATAWPSANISTLRARQVWENMPNKAVVESFELQGEPNNPFVMLNGEEFACRGYYWD
jgi:hypothetical protein